MKTRVAWLMFLSYVAEWSYYFGLINLDQAAKRIIRNNKEIRQI